ncbi:MAG: outer membrane beta-barrel protein [Cecembia sp.]
MDKIFRDWFSFRSPLILFLIINVGINFCYSHSTYAQDNAEDEQHDIQIEEKQSKWSNLPYFMDDLKVIVGVNRSGIYWSDQFRDLNYGSGVLLGLEGFIPMGNISFFHYGMHYSTRNFSHLDQVSFRTNHLDFPIFASFSLPEFRSIDWRFLLGTQLSARVGASQSGVYPVGPQDQFQFDTNDFKNFDGGMLFGLSAEKNDFYFRLRSYVGVNKVDRKDQGGINVFYIDFGYFLFRQYRQ